MNTTGYKLPTETDFMAERALYNILEPRYHHLIPNFLKTSSDIEKKGLIKLAKLAEPSLTKTIGRPMPNSFSPTLKESAWYQKRGNPNFMPRSDSVPFMTDMSEYQVPSWMHEDSYEADQIPKPGGCIIKLKDNITIMRMKNTQRNQGTYKLFSGQFDGTTTSASCHNLESLGLAPH
mmetsp:Transcript_31606/g.57474  ORF Transcript_31606/g.57474 Transcript_31606/m.57474 type:complete len:177 (-) Transcript_31606:187-717(-)|eukprot:CAMPEP_0197621298 /NCGR_PEP_ID=MMETSP1338-20131121/1905_1 /TAXON_ID=43686 ORGANISM="Pelagodinium beii, Strain RCC1491" /NCGR_SAMPLE_ID=MMETSP1338 /ASSEMBLY_ACC=CAM_ASM_000754 /LENGTH=176 /DNA_ID=CAMNT_0043190717 /DNA_START=100 /DNA_END=630 /DNA_ORIENTATION=-